MIDILFLNQNSETKNGDPSMVGTGKEEGSTKERLPQEPPSKQQLMERYKNVRKQPQSEAHKTQMVDLAEEDCQGNIS